MHIRLILSVQLPISVITSLSILISNTTYHTLESHHPLAEREISTTNHPLTDEDIVRCYSFKMTGGGSSSSSSSSPSPPTNPRQHFLPPPLNTPSSSTHNGIPAATPKPPPPPPPPPPQQRQYTPPLLLTVRFSTSIPDLLLDIPYPRRTTVAALKHLIRSRLEQPNSQRRLRFIHGGKILPDGAALAAVLKALPPPPPAAGPAPSSSSRDDTPEGERKGKGKGKAVEGAPGAAGQQQLLQQRVYVNCSIGDLLTDAELDEERRRAEEPAPEPHRHQSPLPPLSTAGPLPSGPFQPGGQRRAPGPLPLGGGGSTAAPPRGFDRLLSAGFTAAEVNQLRLQFRSIQGARHTADTMPSPDALRGLEDAWIDNNHNDSAGAGAGAGVAGHAGENGGGEDGEGPAAAAGDEFGAAGVLDVLLVGMLVGFVWPLGAVGWLVRDEEKISKRMRVFMYLGFVFSFLVGTIRAIG